MYMEYKYAYMEFLYIHRQEAALWVLLFVLLTRPLKILHHPKSNRSAWPVRVLPEQESHPDHRGLPHPLQRFKTLHLKLQVALLNISFAAAHPNWTDGTVANPPISKQSKHLWFTVLLLLNASSFKRACTAHLESPVCFNIFVWKRRILMMFKYFVCCRGAQFCLDVWPVTWNCLPQPRPGCRVWLFITHSYTNVAVS